jgi:hypothetical protein
MKHLFSTIVTIALLWVSNVLIPDANAAGVNCSYDACLKECLHRGATGNGCNKWCSDAMTERKNAGQCKK